jgi:hypothetical protein
MAPPQKAVGKRGGTDYEPLVQSGDETPSRQGTAAPFPAGAGAAGLAQLVEHVICNHGVTGSNPVAGTNT